MAELPKRKHAPITMSLRRDGNEYVVSVIGWRAAQESRFSDAYTAGHFLQKMAFISRANVVFYAGGPNA